jgi:hypothetical protein
VVLNPLASFWVLAVLRPLRIYGTFTFLRQGWITRTQVEVHAQLVTEVPAFEE